MKRRPPSGRDAQLRQHIASEAARLMVEGGIRDYGLAKRKAVAQLNVGHTRNLPANQEIEQAVVEYQRLFRSQSQPQQLRRLREAALRALRFFEPFDPRLVGPVLSGTADEHSPVELHLFADTPEEVDLFLAEWHLPHELDEQALRMTPERVERYPRYRFVAEDVRFEATVFSRDGLRQAPLSTVDGRPMRRANVAATEALLEEGGGLEPLACGG